jgi:UDP-glucuronate decarboxylase
MLVEGMIKLMNSRDDFTGPVNVGNLMSLQLLSCSKNNRINWLKVKITYQPLPSDDPIKTARYFFSSKRTGLVSKGKS